MRTFISTVVLLLVSTVVLSISAPMTSSAKPLKLNEVVSIQVISGGAGHDKLSPLYQKSDLRGKMIIDQVVGWINTSKQANGSLGSSVKGGHPPFIQIKTTSDEMLSVSPAWNCQHASLYTTCNQVTNELVVSNETGGRRIRSAELYRWLKDGWKSEQLSFDKSNRGENPAIQPQVPAYAKWGNMAVQETIKRYGIAVIDYLHVGRTDISARRAEEKFKLWLKKPDGKEFGVYVTIRFDPLTDSVESIRFVETDR